MGGSGETQLQVEKMKISEAEAKIAAKIEESMRRTDHLKEQKKQKHSSEPIIALIGYTNAGKTALMNIFTGAKLESDDKLF